MIAGTLLVQELKMKGLAAGDIDHGLRSMFGDAMRIEVAPADQEDDEDIGADMRYGEQRHMWTDSAAVEHCTGTAHQQSQ
jgi:hypothetical protein